ACETALIVGACAKMQTPARQNAELGDSGTEDSGNGGFAGSLAFAGSGGSGPNLNIDLDAAGVPDAGEVEGTPPGPGYDVVLRGGRRRDGVRARDSDRRRTSAAARLSDSGDDVSARFVARVVSVDPRGWLALPSALRVSKAHAGRLHGWLAPRLRGSGARRE